MNATNGRIDGVFTCDLQSPDALTLPETDPILIRNSFERLGDDLTDRMHDADFWFFQDLSEETVFCDIGANIGQSVNSLRLARSKAHVHSFEINPALSGAIKANAARYAGAFNLHQTGLSDEASEISLFIPVNGNKICDTLATVDLEELRSPYIMGLLNSYLPGAWGVVKTHARVTRFDDMGISPDIVKIDVEGHELSVLRGMHRTLSEDKPILLIEDSDPKTAIDFLAPYGYVSASYEHKNGKFYVGTSNDGNNTFYLHAAKFHELERQGRVVLGSRELAYPHGASIATLNVYAGLMATMTTRRDVEEAYRSFYGFTPNDEMVAQFEGKMNRRELRNTLIAHLTGML